MTRRNASAASAASASAPVQEVLASVNPSYFLNDQVLDKVNAGNAASTDELRNLVEWYAKDLRTFSTKTKRFAASMIVNTIARRNMSGFAMFYTTISSCGELGKKIAQDAFAGLQTACQESGKHELAGKSFAKKTVRTKDGQKTIEFSFLPNIKSSVWTSALRWAKAHKSEILTFRLPKEDKKPMTWLDRLCGIANTWSDARSKSMTGSESSVQSEQLERLNAQLDKLGKDTRAQVLEALTVLASIELPD